MTRLSQASFKDWPYPIVLIHEFLKLLPNDMDKAKERIKHLFVQDCKGDPLARLVNQMDVSSEKLPHLKKRPGELLDVLDSSSYMFN